MLQEKLGSAACPQQPTQPGLFQGQQPLPTWQQPHSLQHQQIQPHTAPFFGQQPVPPQQAAPQQPHQHYHSDENKSQRSNDSGTLAHANRRARRTSSYSRYQSFHDDDEE